MADVPFLELRDAVVRRAGRDILAVDELIVPEGQSLALLGPNGAGKSTLVRLITREVLPLHRDEPPVLFRGDPRATLADVKRALGVVSSSMQDQIAVHLPAWELVAGGLFGSVGVPRRVDASPDQRRRALDAMDELGIADLAERDIMTLSTGQARRVLIAKALVADPRALVFDEPCTGLDPEGMYHVRRAMSELARSGRAVVLVTHYPEDIVPEIDRLLLIRDGRVVADGPKSQLLTGPVMSDLFGVPLRVMEEDGHYALRAAD
ncbi:MAG: ATP-binding cassette domain-containing protein [Eggerthellaceae bacterium]|nr:ATP-binding cassette domain-containing protein [Eggerthellaceae bacterium]